MHTKSMRIASLGLAIAASLLAGCGDKAFVNTIPTNVVISMQDQCDSASFNATLGAGTCIRQGTVTVDQFNAELGATQKVASWRFLPADFSIRTGQVISALNEGGEVHTFTEVEQFGGGIVPALNTASGNPTMAPECANLASTDRVSPGGTFTTDPATSAGTERYQCCIHPWMRSTVTVTP